MGQKLSVLNGVGTQLIRYMYDHLSSESFSLLCKCLRADKKRIIGLFYKNENPLYKYDIWGFKELIYIRLCAMVEKEMKDADASHEEDQIKLTPEGEKLLDEVQAALDLLRNSMPSERRRIKLWDKPCPVCGKYMQSQFRQRYVCPECHYLSTGLFVFERPEDYTMVNPDSGMSFIQHKAKYEAEMEIRRAEEKTAARYLAEKKAEEKRQQEEEKRRNKFRERNCVRRRAIMFH